MEGSVELSWDNSYFGEGNKKLLLFDIADQRIIDMSLQNNYQFRGKRRAFRAFYGELDILEDRILPTTVYLNKPYPNPFSSSTNIDFTIPEDYNDCKIRIEVIDMLGKSIRVLTEGRIDPGFHKIEWDGTDNSGKKEGSGLYLVIMKVTSTDSRVLISQKVLKR